MNLLTIPLPEMLTAAELEVYFRVTPEFIKPYSTHEHKMQYNTGKSTIPPVPRVLAGKRYLFPTRAFSEWFTTYHAA